jgi:hypothetical protein
VVIILDGVVMFTKKPPMTPGGDLAESIGTFIAAVFNKKDTRGHPGSAAT